MTEGEDSGQKKIVRYNIHRDEDKRQTTYSATFEDGTTDKYIQSDWYKTAARFPRWVDTIKNAERPDEDKKKHTGDKTNAKNEK